MHTHFDKECSQDLDTRNIQVHIICLGCKSRASITVTEEQVIKNKDLLMTIVDELIFAHIEANA